RIFFNGWELGLELDRPLQSLLEHNSVSGVVVRLRDAVAQIACIAGTRASRLGGVVGQSRHREGGQRGETGVETGIERSRSDAQGEHVGVAIAVDAAVDLRVSASVLIRRLGAVGDDDLDLKLLVGRSIDAELIVAVGVSLRGQQNLTRRVIEVDGDSWNAAFTVIENAVA